MLNGYIQAGGKERGARIALMPTGTGGDFRRAMGLASMSVLEQMTVIRDAKSMAIDCGKVQVRAHHGSIHKKVH